MSGRLGHDCHEPLSRCSDGDRADHGCGPLSTTCWLTTRAEGRCALDTEFVWERTYAPRLCLAQMATADRLAVIDPLEGAPLEPVAELVADPGVTW